MRVRAKCTTREMIATTRENMGQYSCDVEGHPGQDPCGKEDDAMLPLLDSGQNLLAGDVMEA
jgi:hypothetical protein